MFKKILITLAVIILVFVIVVATRPADFRIVRSTTIAAPASVVFAHINDLQKWEAWSPWEKRDLAMKKTFDGAAAGTGAIYSWAGNKEVGEGRMTITESRADEVVRIKLEFMKPFEQVSTTEFSFKAEGDKTTVTWDMSGKNDFMSRAVCMFMNMEKMVGGDFEQGLASLKTVCEKAK